MKYRTLGRTGLEVSQIGLGTGGPSCLGRKKGKTEAESIRVAERAIDLGINLIDTSERSQTEGIIGRAISLIDRDKVILSTKRTVSTAGKLTSPVQFRESIEGAFRRLQTDYIDILHFHGVLPHEYDYVVEELLPVLLKLKETGAIGFIGLTEAFDRDRSHGMLHRAISDDYWDVMMVGFNLVNQTARERIFTTALRNNIGVLGMFAVRRVLSDREQFAAAIDNLKRHSLLESALSTDILIDRLLTEGQSLRQLINIAYRYCRDEPAVNSVLVGTGELAHLEANVAAFKEAPLEERKRQFITDTFAHVVDFSGN